MSLFTFLVNGNVQGQISSKEVDQLVEEVMEQFNIAGAAVGIVKDGKIIHTKGYGVKSIETKEKVNEHTEFAIASNSKAFTSAALAILVDNGKLSWQDRVIDHIPEFKMYNTYVTENFNIQDLLTHRSGLRQGAGDLMFIPDGTDFTINDVLTSFQYFDPQSAFRTKYDYDNLLYLVAGEVIARVSGMSWEEFVQKHIFQPLNMDNTHGSFSLVEDNKNVATPHSNNAEALRTIAHFNQIANGAAGGVFSNVDDLCNWMLVHLNKGKYGNNLENQLFSEAGQREMWKIHTSFVTYPNSRYTFHFSGYGLGWNLMDTRGNLVARHGGLLPGMASEIVLIPDLNFGLVLLLNTADEWGFSPVDPITFTVIDSYLGLNNNQWIDKIYESVQNRNKEADSLVTAVWKTVASANSDHIQTENYLGVYQDDWFGKVEIFMNNGQLWFKSYRSPKLNGKMSYYKANAFAIKWDYQDMNADAFAIFNLDEEGLARGIKMKGISPDIDFSFDFQDLDFRKID